MVIFSVVTIFSATALIAIRIRLMTQNSSFRGTYRHIIRILVESAALYTSLKLIQGSICIAQLIKPPDLDTAGGAAPMLIYQIVATMSLPAAVRIYIICTFLFL